MDKDEDEAAWESVFPTNCLCCGGVLTWYLWSMFCPECDVDRDED